MIMSDNYSDLRELEMLVSALPYSGIRTRSEQVHFLFLDL